MSFSPPYSYHALSPSRPQVQNVSTCHFNLFFHIFRGTGLSTQKGSKSLPGRGEPAVKRGGHKVPSGTDVDLYGHHPQCEDGEHRHGAFQKARFLGRLGGRGWEGKC
jgi:hypothetical protein